MDEDYILVPKNEIFRLKEEIKELKGKLKSAGSSFKSVGDLSDVSTNSNEKSNGSEGLNSVISSENSNVNSNVNSSVSNDDSSLKIDFDFLLKKIKESISEEMNKERSLILENLSELKEINKSTLDNLLTKSVSLESQLEEMIDSIGHLVENLLKVTNRIPDVVSLKKDINDLILRRNIVDNQIIQKLKEIEIFLNNLKILLSYVKPNDFILEKR